MDIKGMMFFGVVVADTNSRVNECAAMPQTEEQIQLFSPCKTSPAQRTEERQTYAVQPTRMSCRPCGIFVILSDGKTAKCLQEVAIDGLVVLDSLGERHVHNLIVLNADHHIALVFHKSIDGGGTHT